MAKAYTDTSTTTSSTTGTTDTVSVCAMAEALDDPGIIPFADEAGRVPTATEPVPVPSQDTAEDAFGAFPDRRSLVDRELGLERFKKRREGRYACPCCGHGTSRVMRVRVGQRPGWTGVCAVCAATLLARIPGTIVGGMVRPTRRKRLRPCGQTAHGFRRVAQDGYRRAG